MDEWDETNVTSSSRGMRGGSFDYVTFVLLASFRDSWDPSTELSTIGFRVASIAAPEPSTMFLAIGAVLVLPTRPRKPASHNRA